MTSVANREFYTAALPQAGEDARAPEYRMSFRKNPGEFQSQHTLYANGGVFGCATLSPL
ncbi:MAG: hypothetical protein SFV81_02485 [Pirellulaceae bacterium]|nr:hypothetical protein [Pirellulaceae bacterium]